MGLARRLFQLSRELLQRWKRGEGGNGTEGGDEGLVLIDDVNQSLFNVNPGR
jgi:hypothetical protein